MVTCNGIKSKASMLAEHFEWVKVKFMQIINWSRYINLFSEQDKWTLIQRCLNCQIIIKLWKGEICHFPEIRVSKKMSERCIERKINKNYSLDRTKMTKWIWPKLVNMTEKLTTTNNSLTSLTSFIQFYSATSLKSVQSWSEMPG